MTPPSFTICTPLAEKKTGASASLDDSTLIGEILTKGAEDYDDNAINTRLLKRAQKLCNARDEAVRELFNKPPPAELPAIR